MPTISVVIPTRNRSSLLHEAVRSVLAQTLSPIEILIVDDGSGAEHAAGNAAVTRLDARVVLHRLPRHGGVSVARNVGIDRARGDFLLFLDDDDLLHPRMLEECVAAFERSPAADVVTCLGLAFIGRSHSADSLRDIAARPNQDGPGPTYSLSHPEYLKLERVTYSGLLRYFIAMNSCLVRRRAIGCVRFPEDLTRGEDTYFWLLLASQGCRFEVIRQNLAYVRYHGGSSRVEAGHDEEVLRFFRKLVASGMLVTRHDRFIVHAQLARRFLRMKRVAALRHVAAVLCAPDLLARHLLSVHHSREMVRMHRILDQARLALAAEARRPRPGEPSSQTP